MSGNTTKKRHPLNLNLFYSSRPAIPRNGGSN